MKKRTIHYAGQEIIVGEDSAPTISLKKPEDKLPRRVFVVALLIAILVGLALASRAATPTLAKTGDVSITPVFLSSSAATATLATITLSSRTTTTNKTFYLQHLDISAFLVTPSSFNVVALGAVGVQSPVGTVIATMTFTNSSGAQMPKWVLDLAQPLPFTSQVTLSVGANVTTTSPVTWISNLIGYEQ